MPIYMYRCTDCGHEFEARQRMTDEPLEDCPECGGNVRRVVNSVGVVFKGKGFYVTDNRGQKAQSPGSPTSKKEDDSSGSATKESKSSSDGSGNGESKPSKSEKGSSEKSSSPA